MLYRRVVSTMLAAALEYAERGWYVFPVNPETKHPFSKKWFGVPETEKGGFYLATRDPAKITEWWSRAPRAMIAVRTGAASGIFAIDCDSPKADGDPDGRLTFAALSLERGYKPLTHAHVTPSGGAHYLFRWDPEHPVRCFSSSKDHPGPLGPAIDLRGEGGYLIVPPSERIDGEIYSVAEPMDYFRFAEAPPWIFEMIAAASKDALQDSRADDAPRDPPRTTNVFGFERDERDPFWRNVNAEALKRPEAWVTALFPTATHQPGTGAWRVTSKNLGRDFEEDLSIHPRGIRDYGRGEKLTPISLVIEHGGAGDACQAALWLCDRICVDPATLGYRRGSVTRQARSALSCDWYQALIKTARGSPLAVLANVMMALRSDPDVQKLLAYDEFAGDVMLMHPVPTWGAPPADGFKPRAITDHDVSALQEWLQLAGLPCVSKDLMHQAVDQRARECAFHPVRDYLDALAWDGTPRLDHWLASYLGTEPSDYASAIGRMFLVGVVARVYQPGCKLDHMLVLEGPQGARKSTACAILGGEWFSDNLPDLSHGKDVQQHLAGKWLIEIAELSATSKAEAEALKAFVTRTTERYRPSYGRKEISQPRQCVFIGTTNKDAYLRDETGGRRFWPVKVGTIDTGALARDRDQLLAEACKLFHHGAAWWPDDASERALIRPEQEARFETDAWEEVVAPYVEDRERVTVLDVATNALELPPGRVGTADSRRIVAILHRLGFKRGGKDRRGRQAFIR